MAPGRWTPGWKVPLKEIASYTRSLELELGWWVGEEGGSNSPLFDGRRPHTNRRPGHTQCLLCGQVLDRFCDRVAVSPCAGDRTRRRDAIAHVLYESAQEASLRPQKEKAGLLQRRSPSASRPRPTHRRLDTRREEMIAEAWDLPLPPSHAEPWHHDILNAKPHGIEKRTFHMPPERPPLHPSGF